MCAIGGIGLFVLVLLNTPGSHAPHILHVGGFDGLIQYTKLVGIF
jgi:hypothetical protein